MYSDEIIEQYRYDAQGLASYFGDDYFSRHEKKFPINPFQIMTDLGIHFLFRNFERLEGLFLPASDGENVNIVAINAKRNITRQRFTAAHEICHFIKDVGRNEFVCLMASKDFIEKYADAFASAFLMPYDELKKQISKRERHDEPLTDDDVLIIADYFGVSFEACYYRIRNQFPYLLPYKDQKEIRKYRPDRKRREMGMSYVNLYEDLINSWPDIKGISTEYSRQVFKNRYVFNDARLEKVDTTYEAVAEVVQDLFENRRTSVYCDENHEAYCNVAGHALMYDYIFDHAYDEKLEIYMLSSINKVLFSCVPNEEYGGGTRKNNTLVLGTKFETVDWHDIMPELIKLNASVVELEANSESMKNSEIIKKIIEIHHRITVIHPFPDGNGRTSRGFMNVMLIRYGMVPIYIKLANKEIYYAGLSLADKSADFSQLYEFMLKSIIDSHVELAEGFAINV